MYGVPESLDLSIFIGATLEQVCLGRFQAQFIFDPYRSIGVEGKWQILAPTGQLLEDAGRGVVSEQSSARMLLGREVVGATVQAPDWFALHFEDGVVLRIFDDSQQYESFSIQPGDIFV